MGLFDVIGDVFDSVGGFFADGGIDVGDIITTGAKVVGAFDERRANDDAAARFEAAQLENAAAIRAGNAAATARFDELSGLARPGTDFLRSVVAADPFTLTPSQTRSLDDARRDAGATLAASGLRGAGRATTAAIRNVESDFRNRATDSNLRRADVAASQLTGVDASATTNAAVIDANTGRATGSAALASGTADAEAELANESLRGRAIGDISSVLSSAFKERGRDPRIREKPKERAGEEGQRATL